MRKDCTNLVYCSQSLFGVEKTNVSFHHQMEIILVVYPEVIWNDPTLMRERCGVKWVEERECTACTDSSWTSKQLLIKLFLIGASSPHYTEQSPIEPKKKSSKVWGFPSMKCLLFWNNFQLEFGKSLSLLFNTFTWW